jgi:hypothetical protein
MITRTSGASSSCTQSACPRRATAASPDRHGRRRSGPGDASNAWVTGDGSAIRGAPAGHAAFHVPITVTMTVLLHSRPPSPAGSGRWSVTAMCPVSVNAVSGSGALRHPSGWLM